MATASKITKPSIQAVLRLLASATATSTTIESKLATIRILRMKSSKASLNSSKKVDRGGSYLELSPKACLRLWRSPAVLLIPFF